MNLQHQYQAWIQGNKDYIANWSKFAEWAAVQNNTTVDRVLKELERYSWFEIGRD